MTILYLLALLPIAIGCALHLLSKEVCWTEWLLGSALALATAGAGQLIISFALTADTETWSGRILNGVHQPAWTENYEEAVYKTETYTDSEGNSRTRQVFSHYETRSQYHPETFSLYSDIGSDHSVHESKWNEVKGLFGGQPQISKKRGVRTSGRMGSRMVSGDPFDYHLSNGTGWIEPIHIGKLFENRLRNSSSIFRFRTLSEEEQKGLFPYPAPSRNAFASNRLLGGHPLISQKDWDQLNARLGPTKHVNLILLNMGNLGPEKGQDQIAFWEGGKKNDLILLYGNGWSEVQGWTDAEICKTNLRSILLEPNDENLLQKIEQEVIQNYEKPRWREKFEHISLEPKGWQIGVYLVILLATQSGLYFYFHRQDVFGRNAFSSNIGFSSRLPRRMSRFR